MYNLCSSQFAEGAVQKCIWCVHFTVSNVTNAFGAAVFSRSENKGSAKMYFCKATQVLQ